MPDRFDHEKNKPTPVFKDALKQVTHAINSIPESLKPDLKETEIIYCNHNPLYPTKRVPFIGGPIILNERAGIPFVGYMTEFEYFLYEHFSKVMTTIQAIETALRDAPMIGTYSHLFPSRSIGVKGLEAVESIKSQNQLLVLYLAMISFELGQTAIPVYMDVNSISDLAKATFIDEELIVQALEETGYKPETSKICLIGRKIIMLNKKGFYKGEFGTNIENVLQRIFPEIYQVYVQFILYCKKHRYDPKSIDSLNSFRLSPELKNLILGDQIYIPQMADAALAFGGFENLLLVLKEEMDAFSSNIYKITTDEEAALATFIDAYQSQRIIDKYLTTAVNQGDPFQHQSNTFDTLIALTEQDIKVNQQELDNIIAGGGLLGEKMGKVENLEGLQMHPLYLAITNVINRHESTPVEILLINAGEYLHTARDIKFG